MFGAVSAHKYIIAFCIGVELLAAGTKRWLSAVYIFTFSFVSALGIGVGVLLVGGAGATAAGIYSVVLQVNCRYSLVPNQPANQLICELNEVANVVESSRPR